MDGEPTEAPPDRFTDLHVRARLIGQAPAFLKAVLRLPTVAQAEETVLISGETGTGKELVARAIHYLGSRAADPFVPVNCGALPDTLLEDELFGHEPGAFTDARARRRGLIAQAHNGTLFLDEIDVLTAKAQAALLRVLQDRTFRPLGASREERANVRFLTATNVPLRPLVQAGRFRADLYYRLSVFSIDLPPLRERREDIIPLAEHFLLKYTPAVERTPQLTLEARMAVVSYGWPGNVRELESAIIRAIRMGGRNLVDSTDLGLPASTSPNAQEREPGTRGLFQVLKHQAIEAFERDYLLRLMAEHRGNVTHAARAIGKERRELGKLLKKHQLDPRQFSERSSTGLAS